MGGMNAVALGGDETQVVSVGQERCVTSWDLRSPEPLHIHAIAAEDTDESAGSEAKSIAVSAARSSLT
jgi:hypothetical protein